MSYGPEQVSIKQAYATAMNTPEVPRPQITAIMYEIVEMLSVIDERCDSIRNSVNRLGAPHIPVEVTKGIGQTAGYEETHVDHLRALLARLHQLQGVVSECADRLNGTV